MKCPSDYELDAFWLEGKPQDHPVQRHLDACERCRERLVEWKQAEEKFHTEVYPLTEEKVVERLTESRAGFLGFFTYPRLAAAGAALLAVVLAVVLWHPEERGYIGIKGTVGLEVYCNRAGQVFRVQAGDTLLPEDRIRFAVSTSEPGYVMIVSVDPQGEVSLFTPLSRVSSGRQELEGSVILDESVGPERIYALFSEESFDFGKVRDAGGASELVRLPKDLAQTSLLIHKEKMTK